MAQTISIDGRDYDITGLSDQGKQDLAVLHHITQQLQEAQNMQAILTKARKAYLAELKNEIVMGKSGVDLSSLFSD